MSEHAYELPAVGAGDLGTLGEEIDAAVGGDVVYLTRGGRRVAALVPAAVAPVAAAAVEALEDAEDARAGVEALAEWEADGRVSYPFEQVRAEADARDAGG